MPPFVVPDGEAVIWNKDWLDFDALQQRTVTSRAALPTLAKELPASFAAFDVLAVAGQTPGPCRGFCAAAKDRKVHHAR
ncbi:hypothetical protein [Pseudarthrobacter sp. NamE2]|uniref:hypothetical protein n=1 Tax=Pseudarthrobacter sp. NamE2 TaxID=2576838 RepID=UPI001F10E7C0|nr:hypothetical protein [Pseudarthrobacter sp. NamE2]